MKTEKDVDQQGVTDETANKKGTDPYLLNALKFSITLVPLYESQPIEVLNKISTRNCTHVSSYDYILLLPQAFFDEFEASLYVIPFVYTDKIEFAFFIHRSDLEDRPQFIYEAERWISGFLAGRDLRA